MITFDRSSARISASGRARSQFAAVEKAAVDATREAKAAEGTAQEAATRFAAAQAKTP